jgi:secondary thiamine-phosphate synthase enzyme
MHVHTASISVRTRGKGTYEITSEVEAIVRESEVRTGQVTVFIQHTSASLIIYENADRSARVDLESYFDRLVPEDANYFVHTAEGPDDMPSHIHVGRNDCRSVKHPRPLHPILLSRSRFGYSTPPPQSPSCHISRAFKQWAQGDSGLADSAD